MTKALVHKSYIRDNLLVPWKLLGFVETGKERYKLIKSAKFKKGDLFATVSMDHVSDIENHIRWLGIAINTRTVKDVPENTSNFDTSWFKAYQTYGIQDLFDLLPASTGKETLLIILYLCSVDSVLGVISDPSFDKDEDFDPGAFFPDGYGPTAFVRTALQAIRRYLQREDNQEQIHAVYEKALDLNLSSKVYTNIAIYGFISAYLYFIFYGREPSYEVRECLNFLTRLPYTVLDVLDLSARFERIIPLQQLLLAVTENKPIRIDAASIV